MRPPSRAPALGLSFLALLPLSASAQPRLSERGSLGQMVDGTTITLDYARPQARGRSPIFGQVVHWGETWTPGANWATNITLSKDVKVNGEPLPKGSYSIWMIPAEDTWTVFFHPTVRLFHTQRPSADSATLRLKVKATPIDAVEILTFAFASVGRDRTTLEMRWDRALVPLEIVVPSSQAVLAAELAPMYTGTWTVVMQGEEPGKADTVEFKVDYKEGHLLGEFTKMSWIMELVPMRAQHSFVVGMVEKGEVLDVEVDYPMVFTIEGDRAVSFIVKSDNNDEWMRGVRAK